MQLSLSTDISVPEMTSSTSFSQTDHSQQGTTAEDPRTFKPKHTLSKLLSHRAEARTDEKSHVKWTDSGSRPICTLERMREWQQESVSCYALRCTVDTCARFALRWRLISSAKKRKSLQKMSGHSAVFEVYETRKTFGTTNQKAV